MDEGSFEERERDGSKGVWRLEESLCVCVRQRKMKKCT
jgi:hypothetical protein